MTDMQRYQLADYVDKLANKLGWQDARVVGNVQELIEVAIEVASHQKFLKHINPELIPQGYSPRENAEINRLKEQLAKLQK